MPVIQGRNLVVGPLADEEKVFYKNFSGTWVANKTNSDDIYPILDFLEMPSDALDVEKSECMKLYIDEHHIHLRSDVQGFDAIDEQRPWTGGKVIIDRRDRRQGGAECWVERYTHGLIFRCDHTGRCIVVHTVSVAMNRTRWTGVHVKDIYEYLELTSDFMQLVTRQDIFGESDKHCQRRVVWDRRLV